MNAVAGARWADYVRTNCTTCKPGPDAAWTGLSWTLIIVGAAVALLGLGMLWFASRSKRGSDQETEQPRPTAAGPVVGLGTGAALIGLIIMAFSASRVEDDKSQLRLAAGDVFSTAVDGPVICRASAVLESQDLPSSGTPAQFLPKAADCDGSPRAYAQEQTSGPAGVFIPVEYVFSPSFSTDGEVTVHDKQDNRSLCVVVPDTDVETAAATAAATATAATAAAAATQPSTADSSTMPLFDDVTVDPSPYIKDGACPDAPVSSPNPQ